MKKSKAPGKPAGQSAPSTLNAQPSTILLAVTGMSPAILTETVWALAQEKPAIIPSRVIVITTRRGRQEIIQQLFDPQSLFDGKSAWDALRAALAAKGHDLAGRLRFGATADDIRVITSADRERGHSFELDDIRTPSENEAAADFLLEQVRAVVENPDQQLIASLAGGRKTMGALLYACMNLAARETDRLTHVLVNEPYETLRGFFFPGQPGGKIGVRDGSAVEPSKAIVELADVPFVPLRNLFVRELHRKAGTFSRLVDSCREGIRQQAAEKVRLTVETTRPKMEVNGTPVTLAPREQLLMLFLATRAKRKLAPFPSYQHALGPLEEFRQQLVKAAPIDALFDWRISDSMKALIKDNTDGNDDLRRVLCRIRGKLVSAGGEAGCLAHCLPEGRRFALDIPPAQIVIK